MFFEQGRMDANEAWMTNAIDSSVTAQNIRHLRALLKTEAHPDKRSILLESLANELAKLPEPVKRAELLRTARILPI